jgi:hypothetical protein
MLSNVHEQVIAERAVGFDDGYSDWAAQWDGVHEQWTLERDAGAGPLKPEYELAPVRDEARPGFVWAIKIT